MSKFDLAQAIFDKIEAAGVDKAAAFFGKTATTISKWKNGTAFPDVVACQKVLDEAFDQGAADIPVFAKPPPQGQTRMESLESVTEKAAAQVKGKPVVKSEEEKLAAAVQAAKNGKRFHIMTPCNRDFPPSVVLSHLAQWKATLPPEVQDYLASMDFEYDATPHHARNVLATRFLKTHNEWSLWLDSDILAPGGNPGWFKRRTSARYKDELLREPAVQKLVKRGKSIIGSVYIQRSLGGKVICREGMYPNGPEDQKLVNEIKKGPQDKVIKTDWVGFGCVVVHRKVFEDILAKVPGVKSTDEKQPHGFFTAHEGGPTSEDVAFAKRALQAGHQSFLDLGVFCAHIGKYAYLPA